MSVHSLQAVRYNVPYYFHQRLVLSWHRHSSVCRTTIRRTVRDRERISCDVPDSGRGAERSDDRNVIKEAAVLCCPAILEPIEKCFLSVKCNMAGSYLVSV